MSGFGRQKSLDGGRGSVSIRTTNYLHLLLLLFGLCLCVISLNVFGNTLISYVWCTTDLELSIILSSEQQNVDFNDPEKQSDGAVASTSTTNAKEPINSYNKHTDEQLNECGNSQ